MEVFGETHAHHSLLQVAIIEDESAAAELLQTLLHTIAPTIHILAVLDSVPAAVRWLSSNPPPDVIFADIQLSDGISFDIFRQVRVESPIIFTTAFDEFALRAFKLNSIDYLLKPITREELRLSLDKLGKYRKSLAPPNIGNEHNALDTVLTKLSRQEETYRMRFLIEHGDTLHIITTENVAYIYTSNQTTYLVTSKGAKHVLDMRLDDLEKQLSPHLFFRANRQYIISVHAITHIRHSFNRKLRIYLTPPTQEEVLVSRERATLLKAWLNQ